MSDHSEDIREEDSVSDTDTTSFLSEIMRPVFYNSNSHTALLSSSFLTSAFTFPIAESMHIIDESIRGYMQFSLTWKKDEQSLDFIPLEQVEDYYPEEIEEELIVPYYASNNHATIERKVTSYSSNLVQGTEVPAVIDNTDDVDDDSFGRSLPQAASRKSTIGDERASYETTPEKKSLKNTTFKEDAQSSKRRESRPSTETTKYSTTRNATKDFNSENVISLGTISPSKMKPPFKGHSDMPHDLEDRREQSTQPAPAIDLSQKKKKASSSPPNEYALSSPLNKQQESRASPKIIVDPAALAKESTTTTTTSIFPRMLKTLPRTNHHKYDDDTRLSGKSSANRVSKLGNKSPSNENDNTSTTDRQSKIENYKLAKIQGRPKYSSQNRLSHEIENVLPNLAMSESVSERSDNKSKIESKTTMRSSIKHDLALLGRGTNNNYHDSIIVSSKQDKSTRDEDNKSPIHAPASVSNLQRRKYLAHNYKDRDDQYSKSVSRAAVDRREQEISSNIDSLNIHHVNDVLPLKDSVISPISSKNVSKLRALKNPTTKTISDTVSASDRSEMISQADKVSDDAPAITINKLDVTVVGDSSRNSTNTMSPLMDAAESSDEISHYFSEYGLGSLNKSYLWKYKVKF